MRNQSASSPSDYLLHSRSSKRRRGAAAFAAEIMCDTDEDEQQVASMHIRPDMDDVTKVRMV